MITSYSQKYLVHIHIIFTTLEVPGKYRNRTPESSNGIKERVKNQTNQFSIHEKFCSTVVLRLSGDTWLAGKKRAVAKGRTYSVSTQQ